MMIGLCQKIAFLSIFVSCSHVIRAPENDFNIIIAQKGPLGTRQTKIYRRAELIELVENNSIDHKAESMLLMMADRTKVYRIIQRDRYLLPLLIRALDGPSSSLLMNFNLAHSCFNNPEQLEDGYKEAERRCRWILSGLDAFNSPHHEHIAMKFDTERLLQVIYRQGGYGIEKQPLIVQRLPRAQTTIELEKVLAVQSGSYLYAETYPQIQALFQRAFIRLYGHRRVAELKNEGLAEKFLLVCAQSDHISAEQKGLIDRTLKRLYDR